MAALQVAEDKLYFDGTLGGGGHSCGILKRGGAVVGTDLDHEALKECEQRFAGFEGRYTLIHGNYKDAKELLTSLGIAAIDGAIIDMGVSSHQVDTDYRGFSYRFDAELDMRMNTEAPLTAREIVNNFTEEQLADILYAFGEEKFARRIAKNIVIARKKAEIVTTGQLVEIIKAGVPAGLKGHPAKKTFQALRIYVNDELGGLKEALTDIFSLIKKGGRFCVITFHSLEDRVVKQTFAELAADCICDKSLPVCVCGHKATAKLLGRIKPDAAEQAVNPRSASATLRIIEKL